MVVVASVVVVAASVVVVAASVVVVGSTIVVVGVVCFSWASSVQHGLDPLLLVFVWPMAW